MKAASLPRAARKLTPQQRAHIGEQVRHLLLLNEQDAAEAERKRQTPKAVPTDDIPTEPREIPIVITWLHERDGLSLRRLHPERLTEYEAEAATAAPFLGQYVYTAKRPPATWTIADLTDAILAAHAIVAAGPRRSQFSRGYWNDQASIWWRRVLSYKTSRHDRDHRAGTAWDLVVQGNNTDLRASISLPEMRPALLCEWMNAQDQPPVEAHTRRERRSIHQSIVYRDRAIANLAPKFPRVRRSGAA